MLQLFEFIDKLLVNKVLWAIPCSYLAGLLLSLSPCSLPMVPVIMGIAEVEETSSRRRALLLSLVFVSGLVLTYIVLGVLASLFGVFFGVVSKHILSRLLLSAVFILFALISWDVIKINLKANININTRRFGILGVFLLGAIVGVSITACVLPVLGSILLIIAQKQDVVYGVSSLVAFALGMGTVYLIFALGGRELLALLHSKPLLLRRIKLSTGFVIMGFALYYLIGIFI